MAHEARLSMRARCPALLVSIVAIGLAGCQDADVVALRLLSSPGLSPEQAFTSMRIRVERTGGGSPVIEVEAAPSAVGSGEDVLDLEGLEPGEEYSLSVIAEVPTLCRKNRAVGTSLPFSHREGGYTIDVRVGCADELALSWEPLPEARVGARVIGLADGDALIVGGAGHLEVEGPTYASVAGVAPVAPITRYDGQTASFSTAGQLVEPRTFPALAATSDGVAVLGGLLDNPLVCSQAVEIWTESAVLVGEALTSTRCVPGAAQLAGSAGLLVAGSGEAAGNDAELYLASGLEHLSGSIAGQAFRYEATAVPLSSGGRAVVVGGAAPADPLLEVFDVDCPGGPCFEAPDLDADIEPRSYAAATYVPCNAGGGAVYVTGGLSTAGTVLDDVFCYLDAPGAGGVTAAGKLPGPRWTHTAVAVRGERWRLLLVGGAPEFGATPYADGVLLELDACTCGPVEASEVVPAPPGSYLVFHGMDRLADGSVLVAGGVDEEGLTAENLPGASYAAMFVPDLPR